MSTLSKPFTDTQCIHSFAVCIASAILSTACSAALIRKAFPETFGGTFVSKDSALHFLSFRSRLLLVASLLFVVDAICQAWYFFSLWKHERPAYLVSRITFIVTFPLTGPLFVHATTVRCALIVSGENDSIRKWLLRISACLTTIIGVLVIVTGTKVVLDLLEEDPTISDPIWATRLYLPTQAAAINGLLPVFAIFVTIWALSANVRRFLSRRRSSSRCLPEQVDTQSRVSVVSRSFHRLRQMRVLGATGSRTPTVVVAGDSSTPSLAGTSQSQSLSQISSAPRSTPTDPEGIRAGANQKISCPLSLTFVLLSIGISVLWGLTIIFHLAGSFVGNVRTFVFAPFLGVLGLWLEASFERLMRLVSVKHAKSSRHGRGRQFFGVTTLGSGAVGHQEGPANKTGGAIRIPSSVSSELGSEVKEARSIQGECVQVPPVVYDD